MLEAPHREEFDWGSLEWLAQGEGVEVSLARMVVCKGGVSPLHRHGNCNEIIHVLDGEIEQRCGDVWGVMKTGDTVLVSSGEQHQTRNVGERDAQMMICYSSGARDYEDLET